MLADRAPQVCTPQLHLETCFVLSSEGRIISTRDPSRERGPLFFLARGPAACAWAVGPEVPREVARELELLAAAEPPTSDLRAPPENAVRYERVLAKLGGSARTTAQSDGPAFAFPSSLPESASAVEIDDESLLQPPFRGWVPGEIQAGRAPALAILESGRAVSVCFCARRSERAAEAGVDTAESHRRRGFGAAVTAAWARAIRATGRVPLYSTSWTNEASLGIARKLRLLPYASSWSVVSRTA